MPATMWRISFASALLLTACASTPPDPTSEAKALLDRQAECWNRGDLPGFVGCYSRSATFLGGLGLVQGAADLLAKYQRAHPNSATRGHLTFEVYQATPIGEQFLLVLGEYRLVRQPPDRGYFTMLLQRTADGKLDIAHDHTTQVLLNPPPGP